MPPWIMALGAVGVLALYLKNKYGSIIPPQIQQMIDPTTGQVTAFDASTPTIYQQMVTLVSNLSPSQGALDFIRKTESLSLTAYQDQAGLWTIGYGHKIVAGDPYYPAGSDTAIDAGTAETQFEADVNVAADCVRNAVTVLLSQGQFDALVSFTFNVGCGKLRSSTLLTKLNNLDYAGAANEFQRWIYAGNQVSNGLVTRRLAEAATFTGTA